VSGRIDLASDPGVALWLGVGERLVEKEMPSRTDLSSDLGTGKLAEENARLHSINAKMLVALEYVLPLLEQGLSSAVDYDQTQEAIAKVQDALAEAERDP